MHYNYIFTYHSLSCSSISDYEDSSKKTKYGGYLLTVIKTNCKKKMGYKYMSLYLPLDCYQGGGYAKMIALPMLLVRVLTYYFLIMKLK